ncbi:TlpA family protein disulfide reductase [Hymenobacter rigui]|uniref:TlpA family protein disulfide reductase n=1 Tax=Hymenobacter rigui TaxID=334424 RepID=A0A3R9Q1B1_9BACT|nr:TlpA disulfide reductase family protein [Hymenobacter rigui]RSK50802.1 TlpA family protein disulfide reductase [Hymenobacter rigui]
MNRPKLSTALQWLLLLAVVVVLTTDLRTPVLGRLQQVLLATGLWRPTLPNTPTGPPTPLTAGGYPHALILRGLDGSTLNLQELRGKAVLVNLWASWCPPCVAEMPGLQRLYEQVDKRKVAFVLISLDENPAKAQRLVQRRGYTMPVYFPTAPLPAPFDTESIPTTVLLGPDGRVAARHEGMADYDTPAFKAALEKLAGSGRP